VKTYREIVNRMQDVRDNLERMNTRAKEEGTLPVDDEKKWGELTDEFDELAGDKRTLEREADMLRVKQTNVGRQAGKGTATERGTDMLDSDPLGEPDSIEDRRFKNPWDTSEVRLGLNPAARAQEMRSRALSAIEKMQGATDGRRQAATNIIEQFDTNDSRISQQVLATSSPEYVRAFGKLARSQGQIGMLTAEERDAVARAMSLTDAAGGYLVPFQLDPTVILTSDGSMNDIRKIARTVVATGDVWNGVSAGAVNWSFDAEADQVSDDTPTFAQPSVTVRTARGYVPISVEAYMDENNVTAEVGRLLAQGKDDLEATVFISGVAASNQPLGIVGAGASGLSAVAGSLVASAAADTVAIDDLFRIHAALPARYRSRAQWLATNAFYNTLRALDPSVYANLADGLSANMLGKPTNEAEAMDGVVNAGAENYMAILGDFSNYVIADRIGTTVEFIPHLFGANQRPTFQRAWAAFYRVGAGLVNSAGFRMYNVT
jgi:HK97 family phage major capsid protein